MLVRRGIMTDPTPLGPWVRRFLLEYLVGERNLARNTQRSYRDALVLLPFIADHVHKSVDQLPIDDITAEHVRRFLHDLEQRRQCRVTTGVDFSSGRAGIATGIRYAFGTPSRSKRRNTPDAMPSRQHTPQ